MSYVNSISSAAGFRVLGHNHAGTPQNQKNPLETQAHAGAISSFMNNNNIEKMDPNMLYQLANGQNKGEAVPPGVQKAAQYFLANPQEYAKIETRDVAGKDGDSKTGNFDQVAQGVPDQAAQGTDALGPQGAGAQQGSQGTAAQQGAQRIAAQQGLQGAGVQGVAGGQPAGTHMHLVLHTPGRPPVALPGVLTPIGAQPGLRPGSGVHAHGPMPQMSGPLPIALMPAVESLRFTR